MGYTTMNLLVLDRGVSASNAVTVGPNTTKYLNFNPSLEDAKTGIAFFVKGLTKGLVQTTITLEYANDPEATTWTALGASVNFGTPDAGWLDAEVSFRRSPAAGDFIPPFCRLAITTGAAAVVYLSYATKSFMEE